MQNKVARLKILLWRVGDVLVKLKRGLFKVKFAALVVLIAVLVLGGWAYHRSQVNKQWEQAVDDYHHANYDAAAKIMNHMPMPKDDVRLPAYAQTMLATRQLDKAATAYQALYNQKHDPFAKLVLGNVYNQQKKYDMAAKVYQDLIKANPNYSQAYVNLATMYKLQGKNTDAVAAAKQAVQNNPNNTVLNELYVSLTMDQKDSPDFKTAVAQLKKLNPQDPLLALIKE